MTLALGGIVGRAENRAMVEALRIPLTPIEELSRPRFDRIAIVDSQPGTGNNSLPAKRKVDIVDRPPPAARRRARPPPGATSAPSWAPPRPSCSSTCATGACPSIRAWPPACSTPCASETRDLGREATDAERDAYLFLVPLVDHKTLSRISHPKVPREHFTALDRALRSARVWGNVVAANLGELSYPDLVAEVADLLLGFDARQVRPVRRPLRHPGVPVAAHRRHARAGPAR